jgi:hypothetical protein
MPHVLTMLYLTVLALCTTKQQRAHVAPSWPICFLRCPHTDLYQHNFNNRTFNICSQPTASLAASLLQLPSLPYTASSSRDGHHVMVKWHSSTASCQVKRAAYKQQHIKVAFQHACLIIVPRTHGILHVTPAGIQHCAPQQNRLWWMHAPRARAAKLSLLTLTCAMSAVTVKFSRALPCTTSVK